MFRKFPISNRLPNRYFPNLSPPPLIVTLPNTKAWIFDHSGYPYLKRGYLGYHLPLN